MIYGWKISSYKTLADALVTIISLQIGIFNYDEVCEIFQYSQIFCEKYLIMRFSGLHTVQHTVESKNNVMCMFKDFLSPLFFWCGKCQSNWYLCLTVCQVLNGTPLLGGLLFGSCIVFMTFVVLNLLISVILVAFNQEQIYHKVIFSYYSFILGMIVKKLI